MDIVPLRESVLRTIVHERTLIGRHLAVDEAVVVIVRCREDHGVGQGQARHGIAHIRPAGIPLTGRDDVGGGDRRFERLQVSLAVSAHATAAVDVREGERPSSHPAILGVLREHGAVALVVNVTGPAAAREFLRGAVAVRVVGVEIRILVDVGAV